MEQQVSLTEILEREIRRKFKNVKNFSEHSGIPYMTISGILKRGVEHTTVGTLIKVCEKLEISVSYLFYIQYLENFVYKLKTIPHSDLDDKEIAIQLSELSLIPKDYSDETKTALAKTFRQIFLDQTLSIPETKK